MKMSKEEKTCVVHEVETELEGQIFEDLLQEAGIPAMVSSTRDAAFDGMEAAGRGAGKVIVLIEDREASLKIIDEYLASVKKKAPGKKAAKKGKKRTEG